VLEGWKETIHQSSNLVKAFTSRNRHMEFEVSNLIFRCIDISNVFMELDYKLVVDRIIGELNFQ
jgi:hypothetical protein